MYRTWDGDRYYNRESITYCVATHNQRSAFLVGVVLTLICSAYLRYSLYRSWVPHDEGMLAHTAERVLQGERPHIEFDDMYTGGLTYLHALSFKVWGIKLSSLRNLLWLSFTLFIFIFYLISLKFASISLAALLTICATTWSVPNYTASMPSWYNLFFALFAIYFLIKHFESRKNYWILFCGTMLGASIAIKIIGIYLAIALLLAILYDELTITKSNDNLSRHPSRIINLLILVFILLPNIFILLLLWPNISLSSIFYFALPIHLLTFPIINIFLSKKNHLETYTFKNIVFKFLLLLLGALVAVLPLLMQYKNTHELKSFFYGVFILPQARLQKAFYPLPKFDAILTILPFILLALTGISNNLKYSKWLAYISLTVWCSIILLKFPGQEYLASWHPLRALVFVIALSLSFQSLIYKHPSRLQYLLGIGAAWCSLVQYPYSSATYLCYCAPIIILALAAFTTKANLKTKQAWLLILIFYTGFGLLIVNRGDIRSLGTTGHTAPAYKALELTRAGIEVESYYENMYEDTIREIHRITNNNELIYAGPESPEIYFLAERKNPTRFIFEFMRPDKSSFEHIKTILAQEKIRLVAINTTTEFFNTFDDKSIYELASIYPYSKKIGRFILFWKN